MSFVPKQTLVKIVQDSTNSEPEYDTGVFVRVIYNKNGIGDNPHRCWSVDARRKGQGYVENYSRGPVETTQEHVEHFLIEWTWRLSSQNQIFLTQEAAELLLPALCAPKVAFQLSDHGSRLLRLCSGVISKSRDYLRSK